MRYRELFEMSRAEAKAVWLRHGVDPDGIPADQLGKERNKLIKRAHPDVGGDVEDAKLINAAYDVLKKPAPTDYRGSGDDWQQDGEWYEERPRRERNWYYDPNENARREREKEQSGDDRWAWAGYSGGSRNSAHIRQHDYTDVNYIKKRMWELSGKSTEEWTIWGFDGNFLRNVTTVYGSPKIFAQMAEAMIKWQTTGFSTYNIRAVLVEKGEPYQSKSFHDDDDDVERKAYVIWADGVFYDKEPIPISYETFNRNPGNDRSFNHRLRRMLDDLQEHGGRRHEQPEMDTKGYSRQTASFETGSFVVHPKYGVGRVVNPAIRKGMARVTFKTKGEVKTGNVKISSLRPASGREEWEFGRDE